MRCPKSVEESEELEGEGKRLRMEWLTTKMAAVCAKQDNLKCCVEMYREREVSSHHSGKETNGDVIPSNSKKEIVHTSPIHTSPPSTGSRSSRKRARRLDITSRTSKRAVALESTGGAATIPDIDAQQSVVKRDPFVKTEMQLFL